MYSFGITELRDAEATLRGFIERHYAGIIICQTQMRSDIARQYKISYLYN